MIDLHSAIAPGFSSRSGTHPRSLLSAITAKSDLKVFPNLCSFHSHFRTFDIHDIASTHSIRLSHEFPQNSDRSQRCFIVFPSMGNPELKLTDIVRTSKSVCLQLVQDPLLGSVRSIIVRLANYSVSPRFRAGTLPSPLY